MKQRLRNLLLTLAIGMALGAFGYSVLTTRQHERQVAAARAEGRAEAEKALAEEMAALKPVAIKPIASERPLADGTAFEYEYVPPKSPELEPFFKLASEGDMLRKLPEIKAIDGLFVLPRPVRFLTAECREPDAFYSPDTGEVVMCYETMKVLLERGQQLTEENDLDEGHAQRYLAANVRFIVSHETGHALIDLLDIPVTGRQEDAVDQLATTLMLRFAGMDESTSDVAENLRMASNWFLVRSTGAYNLDAYADEHALGEQRYFNLQCMLYGSDPARFVGLVASGALTEARAKMCPTEARKISRAWLRLLLPHVAPKFEMTEEKATEALERRERERERNTSEAPYLR